MGVWVLAGVEVCVGVGVLAGVGVCVGDRSPHAIMAIWTVSRRATAAPAVRDVGLVALLRGRVQRTRRGQEALPRLGAWSWVGPLRSSR